MDKNPDAVGILDLPCECLITIFEYLSYEEVAKSRIICKRMDDVCQKILNRGFKRAAHQSAMAYKRIKSLLPRRESERRNHALVRHADILSSVETRLSMLSMTYTKYIDLNMCCFIPGRVLDEIFHILRLTKQRCVSLRPLEILQEFRDISSMAIEHFDEHIASEFKRSLERNTLLKVHSGTPDNMHTSESECGASELFWVRKFARNGFAPLHTMRLPDKVPSSSESDGDLKIKPQKFGGGSAAQSKELVIKKLEKTIAGLEKKQTKQNKYYKRELYRLNRNFCLAKRRLDEMDSKYKELIETVRQYNLEPTSQTSAAATAASNLNAAVSTDNTESNAVEVTATENATHHNENEPAKRSIGNEVASVNEASIDNDELMTVASTSTKTVNNRCGNKRARISSDELKMSETIANKKMRSECN